MFNDFTCIQQMQAQSCSSSELLHQLMCILFANQAQISLIGVIAANCATLVSQLPICKVVNDACMRFSGRWSAVLV